jgi:DNA polymerase/3'-5' exonuclease PolX
LHKALILETYNENGAIMPNKELAEIFNEIADMLSVDKRPTARFEVRAYQNAAMAIS